MSFDSPLIQFLSENKVNFSVYSALELLESAFGLNLEEIPLSDLQLKGNPAISVSSDDLSYVAKNAKNVVLCVNSVSLLGIQGPMGICYLEQLLELITRGDFVLRDFLDIFNQRIIQNLYRIRKSSYLHFYDRNLFSKLSRLFVDEKKIKSHQGFTILASKIPSVFVLKEIILSMVGPGVEVTMEKAVGRWVKFEKNRLSCRLGRSVLGARIWVNELLVITMKCSSREKYEKLINDNQVKDMVSEYWHASEIRIFLEKVKYRGLFLGTSRLLLQICL